MRRATVGLLPFLLAAGAMAFFSNTKAPASKAALQAPLEILAETSTDRLVKHALGETRVPLAPQRIASLSAAATDSLVALGIRPVLVESGWKSNAPAPYIANAMPGLAALRRAGSLSIESLFELNPDLIVAGTQDGRFYGQLSQIAPTIVPSLGADGRRKSILLEIGDVFGVPDRARRRWDEYRRAVAEARERLAGVREEPVVFLRFRQRTCVIYARRTMFGPLLFEDLALTPDSAMPTNMSPGGWDVLSVERLSMLQARHIFMVVDADSEAYWQSVAETPLWRHVPAVRHGHVHRVAATTWIGGDGILANEAIVHDVLAAFNLQGSSDAADNSDR